MIQLPDLDRLIGDGMILCSRHVLRQVVLHLEHRGVYFIDIANAFVDIVNEKGYKQAALAIEDIITQIPTKPYSNQENEDDLDSIV